MRTPTRTALLVSFVLGSAWSSVHAADDWYLEQDGVLILEAEDADVPDTWLLRNDIEDASGSGFIEYLGGGPSTNVYNVTITTAGFYEFRWRSRILYGDDFKEHNDSFLDIPTGQDVVDEIPLEGKTKVYHNRLNRWTWDTSTVDFDPHPIRQYLDAGDHRIEVSGRSAGHGIDRIALYLYDDMNFSESTFDALPNSATSDQPTTPGGVNPAPPRPGTGIDGLPLGECTDNRWPIEPTADVTLDGNARVNGPELSLTAGGQRALLRFELGDAPPPDRVTLRYSVASDDSTNGTLSVYLASDESWTETGDEPLPDSEVLIGSDSGPWELDERRAVTLSNSMVAGPALNLMLNVDPGADELALRSGEAAKDLPRLVLEGCSDSGGDGTTTATTGDDTGGTDDGGDSGGDTSGDAGDDTTGDDDSGDTAGDTGSDSDGGDGIGSDGGGDTTAGSDTGTATGGDDSAGTDTGVDDGADTTTAGTDGTQRSGGGAFAALLLLGGGVLIRRRRRQPHR